MPYKDFLEIIQRRLREYSHSVLCSIILEWAKEVPSSERDTFLWRFVPRNKDQTRFLDDEDNKKLLEELNHFTKRIKDGKFYEGYGWDYEIEDERTFGDESWIEDFNDYCSTAWEALRDGNYILSREIYELIFDILENHAELLPGKYAAEEMVETDLDEARSCYLRATYLSSPLEERHGELLKVVNVLHWNIGETVNVQTMLSADVEPLPDFEAFLQNWIGLLKRQEEKHFKFLLHEAIFLSGGERAIAESARKEGQKDPGFYIKWLDLLEQDENYQEMISSAEEGLKRVSEEYPIERAIIAEALVRAGERVNDTEIQLKGWREAFYSKPSLEHLLSLLSLAEQKGTYKKEIENAVNKSKAVNISKNLLALCYLLIGKYEVAIDCCKTKSAVGWTYGTNPKVIIVPFFLKLISRGDKRCSTIILLWNWALKQIGSYEYRFIDATEHYQQVIDRVFKMIQLTNEEEAKYLQWCEEETDKRVDTIVGNKYRGSYYKAAMLIGATAEIFVIRGKRVNANSLIQKYHKRYAHHRSFRKELRSTVESSYLLQNQGEF